MVTNATLYALLQTVHANQTQIIIPDLAAIAKSITALRSDLDATLAALEAKLDQISLQVTPPETGDFNPKSAVITRS